MATHECRDTRAPYKRSFKIENVYVQNGVLCLKVPGNQRPENGQGVGCAEVETVEDRIKWASVRTIASFSDVPGTCHGKATPLRGFLLDADDTCRFVLLSFRQTRD